MIKKRWFLCAAAMMISLTAGMSAAAEEEAENVHAFSIDMTDNNDEAWERIAMTNDDTVKTGLNIRDRASTDGLVIACLYRGGAVEVVHKDPEWTEVEVGDITGFIKNEYLIYGTEAKGLAEHYGVYGVEASWNDVKVFEQPSGDARIIHSCEAGEKYELLENQGHWQKIKFEDMEAYVSIEDVFPVILVDDLLIVDEPYSTSEDTYEEPYSGETSYSGNSSSTGSSSSGSSSYNSGSTGSSSTGNSSSYNSGSTGNSSSTGSSSTGNSSSAGSSSTGNSSSTGSSSTGNSSSTGSGSAGNSSSAETEGSYESPDVSVDDSDEAEYDDSIYTDDTVVDTEDAGSFDDSETVEEIEDAEEYVDDSASAPEEYTADDTSSDSSTEEYAEEYTEEYVEETEAAAGSASSYSSSDLDLMAAIIYCEAGNQSYEGQVAVGSVVMNRVNSDAFPGTISEVIYQSGQFTPASSGSLASALANGVPSTCYDAASAAMEGENPVGDALYFNGGSGSGVQIGDHQFY